MKNIIFETHEAMIDPSLPSIFWHLPLKAYVGPIHTGVNWHSNIEVLHFVEGEGEVLYDSKLIQVKKGDIVVINSNVFHEIITPDYLECYILIIDCNFCNTVGISAEDIMFEEHIQSPSANAAFCETVKVFQNRENVPMPEIHYAVMGLLLHLYKNHLKSTDHTVENVSKVERIKEIVTYIKMHFTEKLTLDDIAEDNNISKSYLVHEFKRFTGQTIIDYINTLRCINAQSLIRNGINVSSAALSSGFDNLSYFSRVYKKHISKLPSQEKAR